MPNLQVTTWTQILSTNGDGTGNTNIVGDYSVTPGFFYVTPPAGLTYVINHVHVIVAGTATLNMLDYGSILGGVTNGMNFETKVNGIIKDIGNGFRIKQNIDWQVYTDIAMSSFGTGAGAAQSLYANFSFADQYTKMFFLNPGDYVGFRVRDNMPVANLPKHYISVWGVIQQYV